MTVPTLGLVLPDKQPIADDLLFARRAEEAGFTSIWCYELSRDSQVRAVCVAQHTSVIEVGTCVSLWHATPVSAAMRVAEIQRWSAGRFQLGLGVGTEASNHDHHGTSYARPVARMREYLQVVRGAWAATADDPLDYSGDNFAVRGYAGADLEGRPAPPLLLAAIGPGMMQLAVSEADGVILSPSSTPWYTKEVLHSKHEAELESRAAAGRPFRSVVVARCSVDADGDAARERARRSIAWYASVPAHARIASMHGFGPEAAAIAAAWEQGDGASAVAAVSDAMVATFALAGTPDEVRAQIRRWDGVVDSVALLTPSDDATLEEIAANVVGTIEAFA
jgi:alkanesulfonate monooxygenase SsuD/methylene tetrahydromethanopterin reductase-like flavin-dependent oxidoreductase (luciferase family)